MSLLASNDPAVVAVCLDWLHDTLPWPRGPHWQANTESGFVTAHGPRSRGSWRSCEQCGGKGKTKLGRCANCDGRGGWHFDPMDTRRAALRTAADAHPEPEASSRRFVLLAESVDAETERHRDEYPPTLQAIADALELLRGRNPYHRAVLQRVHVIHLDPIAALRPPERELYGVALVHLATLLPVGFRAPRWAREKAGTH